MSTFRQPNLPPGPDALWDWMERRGLNQREAAKTIDIHYMSLNQMLRGKRKPSLASALRIEHHTGIPAVIWLQTRVSATRRRKTESVKRANKHAAYDYVS